MLNEYVCANCGRIEAMDHNSLHSCPCGVWRWFRRDNIPVLSQPSKGQTNPFYPKGEWR